MVRSNSRTLLLSLVLALGLPALSWGQSPLRYVPERLAAAMPTASPDSLTVSFTPQGSLPWLPRKVSIDWLVICAPSGTSVAAGLIYQTANNNGIATLSPSDVKSLLNRKRSLNPLEIALELGTVGSLAVPVLGQSGVISLSSKWVISILAGHAIFDYAQNQITSRIPDPSPTLDLLLDPTGILAFSGGCIEATIGVSQSKQARRNPVAGTFRGSQHK